MAAIRNLNSNSASLTIYTLGFLYGLHDTAISTNRHNGYSYTFHHLISNAGELFLPHLSIWCHEPSTVVVILRTISIYDSLLSYKACMSQIYSKSPVRLVKLANCCSLILMCHKYHTPWNLLLSLVHCLPFQLPHSPH